LVTKEKGTWLAVLHVGELFFLDIVLDVGELFLPYIINNPILSLKYKLVFQQRI
jgi:hypothetical protein